MPNPLEPLSDSQIVQQMATGDRAALAALYERHSGRVFALSRALLRDAKEAEDLLHDVFLEAWRRSADYAEERGSVVAWLLLRTRSRALDRLKQVGRRRSVPADEWLHELTVEPPADEDAARVRAVVASLPEAQQQVVVLAYFEGLSATEIGDKLAVPVGTVKSRLRAALTALRDCLGETSHE